MFCNKINVEKTTIFVAPNSNKDLQITIYSNIATTSCDNLLIIPVPNIETIRYINLKQDVFEILDNNFNSEIPKKHTKIGNYTATIIYSVSELNLLNRNYFGTISDGIKEILEKYYLNFGFIVLKLEKSFAPKKYQPFAYTHKLSGDKLFVPIRQHHSGSSITEELFTNMMYSIYSYNTVCEFNNCVQTKEFPITIKTFDFGTINSFCKYDLIGFNKNKDLEIKII